MNSETAYILAEQMKELYKMMRAGVGNPTMMIKAQALAGQMNLVADIVIKQPHEGKHLGKQEESKKDQNIKASQDPEDEGYF